MPSAQHEKLEQLFSAAVQKPTPAERAAFLDGACGDDAALRTQLEALLRAHEEAGPFLETPVVDPGATVESASIGEAPGTRIGRYKLLQQIGEGGFGTVHIAEQEQPVRRKVALKIIKPGMDTRQVIARFEAERQALAMMEHPNIARVLDAGATGTGRPYFVMELVRGVPITEYCDKNKLSTRERLTLLIQVCHAVQHAHQKGIIHRDIKPNNVLVTLHDSTPVPKVIDFGIAKATSGRLTDKTLFTEFRQFIGTPEYMSPDQAEISGLDIDTRTDIYSLGVLLYELLTGTTPFDANTLRTASYDEIKRIIHEVEPPRPSTRVSALLQRSTQIASLRQTEPATLPRLVRGDLDWIVMKAMEKDRTRRYATAAELANDIERHLNHEPVLAGPPSASYKFRKFVRRHRGSVLAGTLVAIALLVGFSVATTGFVQARREASRSQRIADFLQDLLLSTNPDQAIVSGVDVEQVVATAREVFGDDHATVAATLSSHALQLQSAGELEAAEQLYRESLAIWRERYGRDNISVANTLRLLGLLNLTKGADRAAEQAFRESIRITRALPGEETLTLSETLALLGVALRDRGQYDEAEAALRDSIRIRRAIAPKQHLQIAVTISALTNVLVLAGKEDATAEIMPEVLATWRAALPERSLLLARTLTEIGIYHLDHEEIETAEALFREALDIFRAAPEPLMAYYRYALRGLYRILDRRQDLSGLVPLAIEAVDVAHRLEDDLWLAETQKDLANLCWDIAKDPERSRERYEAALQGVEAYRTQRPDVPSVLNTHGVVLYRLGRYEEALEILAESDAHYSKERPGGFPHDVAFIAMAHHRLGHETEARAGLERLRQIMQQPEFADDDEAQAFRAEADIVIRGAQALPRPGE